MTPHVTESDEVNQRRLTLHTPKIRFIDSDSVRWDVNSAKVNSQTEIRTPQS